MINVSFGVYNINGVKVDTSDFPVYISKDGESWIPLNYKIVSEYDEPKWCLCKAEIYFPASSFERLFIRFTPGTASVYRFDDLRIGSDLNAVTPEDGEIDWTNGAVEMDKGNEVTAG
jgi:hypothetical protein